MISEKHFSFTKGIIRWENAKVKSETVFLQGKRN